MNSEKLQLGIRMAEANAKSNQWNKTSISHKINDSESNDLVKFKQLLFEINEVLENENFLQALETNKEMRASLKELLKKSVDILA